VIPLFALLYFDRWLYFLVGVGVCFLIGAAASRLKPRRRRSLPGERRFTVQMEAPSD
jgi:putative exporter of polyketide antibiotics